MASTQLQVPPSPSSTKRSRSKDSTRSAATSTLSAPFFTPSASTPSLVIPNGGDAHTMSKTSLTDPTPYPAFLRSSIDIHQKFIELEKEQQERHEQQGEGDQPPPWARCSNDEIAGRNRWFNVNVYKNNRIRLRVPEEHNNFINASPLELKSTKSGAVLKYIATQGPKYDTYSHFWRMVWHETPSPAVIVMLTQTHEGNKEKCFPYYPHSMGSPQIKLNAANEFEDDFLHDLNMVSFEENEAVRAQVRELEMTSDDESETKKIWHFLFAGWPDYSAPEGTDREALLKLIDMSREKIGNDTTNNPRIVHCSAGVGRSGTFIILDWLLQELEDGSLDEVADDEDPIWTAVNTLRQQRMMMVQAEPQLIFIYDTLRARWRDRWIVHHADEAERLGVTHNGEPQQPKLKRQKSVKHEVSELEHGEEDRAQLEAELMDAQLDFDKGKT